MSQQSLAKEKTFKTVLSIILAVICILYMLPVATLIINTFKGSTYVKSETFALPNSRSFVGVDNYVWFIARVDSKVCRIIYYLCVFSMVVPFQMVMFTLSKTADTLKLNTPWTIPVVYLGFGAGLAIFMFVGFVKSIPLEIEEAAVIDGCGPLKTYFLVVFPMLKPTMISVGILEIMWVWNDYLLPYLVLDRNLYRTIPIHIQYLQGSYGQVDWGATMALIFLGIVPVVIFYLLCQKHIIKGVAAGAVKG